jgi:hypothetical protein
MEEGNYFDPFMKICKTKIFSKFRVKILYNLKPAKRIPGEWFIRFRTRAMQYSGLVTCPAASGRGNLAELLLFVTGEGNAACMIHRPGIISVK